MVITALVLQVLAILCICIPLQRNELLSADTDSTLSASVSAPHTKQADSREMLPAWKKIGTGTSVSTQGEKLRSRQPGPELLRMLQLYQHRDQNASTTSFTNKAVLIGRNGEVIAQPPLHTDGEVEQTSGMVDDMRKKCSETPSRQFSIELSRFSSELEAAVEREQLCEFAKTVAQAIELNQHVEKSVGSTDPAPDNTLPQQSVPSEMVDGNAKEQNQATSMMRQTDKTLQPVDPTDTSGNKEL